jgi:hypothetical protein
VPSFALTVEAGATLANEGTVALTGTGSVVLSASNSGGAKLTGAGKVSAGAAEIVGGNNGWQATHTNTTTGTVTIAAVTDATATITATSSAVLTAAGEGATITQKARENNNLTIAGATTVALSADGKIELAKHANNPGKLIFGATGAQVSTGNTPGTAVEMASSAGSFALESAAVADKILVSAFSSDSKVSIFGSETDAPKLLTSIGFAATSDGSSYITGPKSGNDDVATIDKDTITTDT